MKEYHENDPAKVLAALLLNIEPCCVCNECGGLVFRTTPEDWQSVLDLHSSFVIIHQQAEQPASLN